jgi:outer membrane protein TolC
MKEPKVKAIRENKAGRREKTPKKIRTLLVVLVTCWMGITAEAQEVPAGNLTLGQAMRYAEKASPALKAIMSRENEAREFSRVADSGFYPDLGLDAVASNGFPGSASGFGTAGLDSFPGLVASPYRQGPAAGAYAKWDLVDLSVWHQSAAAHYEYDASRERTKFQAELVDGQALSLYLEASRLRGDRDAWQCLVDELSGIRDTVKRFVRNGQYSAVQGYLIEDQLADAALRASDFNQQYQAALARLALLTSLDAKTLSCPNPSGLSEADWNNLKTPGINPLVTGAELETKSANETTAKYSAENLPVLEVAGSAGYLSGARLVDSQDYSLFAGISFPIFEGFRIDAQEKAARAEAQARQAEVSADQLTLDDLNVRYTEEMTQSLGDLKTLAEEQDRAAKAVTLARQRYLAFLGPLSDLQQALKDMINIGIQVLDAKTQLLLAVGEKYLLSGGTSDSVK